jgi:predicted ester cyclase
MDSCWHPPGEFLGVAPSNNAVEITGTTMERIEGGKIVETYNNFDQLGMMRQIGAMPAPEQSEG